MKQLHPRVVWLFFIQLLFLWSFIISMGLALYIPIYSTFAPMKSGLYTSQSFDISQAFSVTNSTGWSLIVIAFIVWLFIWAKLLYRFYRYELTDDGFRKESGVIYKRYVTIPYNRIQNVNIYRGVIARLLGLSDLTIQTAGASGVVMAEGRLIGVSQEEAERLRDELIRQVRQSKDQGL